MLTDIATDMLYAYGNEFTSSNSNKFYGMVNSDETELQFYDITSIKVGDIVSDSHSQYLVLSVFQSEPTNKAAITMIFKSVTVFRNVATAKDNFGRSVESTSIIVASMPIKFTGKNKAIVPSRYSIEIGDYLRLTGSETTFCVAAVSHDNGIDILSLVEQSPDSMLKAM